MYNGLLRVTGRISLDQFWPSGETDADTIRVKVAQGDRTGMRIEVDAMLMLSPVPERLRLSTMIDLDNGRATTAVEEA